MQACTSVSARGHSIWTIRKRDALSDRHRLVPLPLRQGPFGQPRDIQLLLQFVIWVWMNYFSGWREVVRQGQFWLWQNVYVN
ncbi:hypothetical protein CKO51_28500 [Rhodopirellula sp. SM50]|nr:hypothetical protein CKO51_28500 [Rhodopirellula sp. SM50]